MRKYKSYQDFEQIENQYLCPDCHQLFPRNKIANHFLHYHDKNSPFKKGTESLIQANLKRQEKAALKTHKICRECKEKKLKENFPKKSTLCKECTKIYNQEWYQKPKNKQKTQERTEDRKQQNRRFIYEYLKEHPCVDCGESDPVILEFDHIKDKKYNVTTMIQRVASKKRILEEIAKCEIRCVNCHQLKTARDQNWYTYRFWLEEKNK